MPRARKKIEEPNEEAPAQAPVSSGRSRRLSTPAFIGILALFSIVVIGGAMYLGKSDRGQIDVSAAIQNANEIRVAKGEQAVQDSGTPEALRNLPNGGLVPQDPAELVPQNPPPETTTDASTTPEGTASSTTPEGETEPGAGADVPVSETQNAPQ